MHKKKAYDMAIRYCLFIYNALVFNYYMYNYIDKIYLVLHFFGTFVVYNFTIDYLLVACMTASIQFVLKQIYDWIILYMWVYANVLFNLQVVLQYLTTIITHIWLIILSNNDQMFIWFDWWFNWRYNNIYNRWLIW